MQERTLAPIQPEREQLGQPECPHGNQWERMLRPQPCWRANSAVDWQRCQPHPSVRAASFPRLDVVAEIPADIAGDLRGSRTIFDIWLQLRCDECLQGVRSGVSLAPARLRLLRLTQGKCFASPSGSMPAPSRTLGMLVSFERALVDRAPSIPSQADVLGPHADIQSHATR